MSWTLALLPEWLRLVLGLGSGLVLVIGAAVGAVGELAKGRAPCERCAELESVLRAVSADRDRCHATIREWIEQQDCRRCREIAPAGAVAMVGPQ